MRETKIAVLLHKQFWFEKHFSLTNYKNLQNKSKNEKL